MSGSYIFLIWNILRAISATLNMKILWCWRSVFAVCFSYYCRFWGLQIESFLKYSDTWLLWIVFHFYSENSSLWNNFYYFSPFRVLWRLMLIESHHYHESMGIVSIKYFGNDRFQDILRKYMSPHCLKILVKCENSIDSGWDFFFFLII